MRNIRTMGYQMSGFLLAAICAGCSTQSAAPDAKGSVGSVGMHLTIAPGIHLTTMHWTIRDESESSVLSSHSAHQHPWAGGAAEGIEMVIGGVPRGGPYTIELSGNASGGEVCEGTSADFEIEADATSSTEVAVVCTVSGPGTTADVRTGTLGVNGTVTAEAGSSVDCPGISGFSVNPTRVDSNGTAQLNLETVGPAPESVNWSSTAGSVRSSNTPDTELLCNGFVGELTVTAAIEGPPACAGQPYLSQSTTVTCEAVAGPGTLAAPGAICAADTDCAGFDCVAGTCGPYAATCQDLADRGAPPGDYVLDTDGAGPNPAFVSPCVTGSPYLPPVGLCQAEPGAPPACRSFVGAVGYDFVGVDFGGAMEEDGWLEWQGQPVTAAHDILELSDGAFLSNSYSVACCYAYFYNPARYPLLGGVESLEANYSDGWGMVELFDGRILVGGTSQVATFAPMGGAQQTLITTASLWPSQTLSGRILVPSRSVNEVLQLNPDGASIANTSDASFLVGNVDSTIQLADGAIIVGIQGNNSNSRLAYFERDMSPRVFSEAPAGMILNPDGSTTRSDMIGVGSLLQLPNGQVLVANPGSNTILRLNPDGSYIDTVTLPAGWSSPTGMTLDHHGRLLVALDSTAQIHVVTFPGCSDGSRTGSETDVDCGGACTARCVTNQMCQGDSDCASEDCRSGICQ